MGQEVLIMRETRISLPVLGLIGATRGMLGVGLGMLLSGRLSRDHRIAVGCTLAAIGALSTIPLIVKVVRGRTHVTNGHSYETAPQPQA
jgi:hypothetical protein